MARATHAAQYAWLANATGWSGCTRFERSGRWHLKQQHTRHVKDRSHYAYDPDIVGAQDVGQFNYRVITS